MTRCLFAVLQSWPVDFLFLFCFVMLDVELPGVSENSMFRSDVDSSICVVSVVVSLLANRVRGMECLDLIHTQAHVQHNRPQLSPNASDDLPDSQQLKVRPVVLCARIS